MKKILVIFLLLLVTGCGNKELVGYFDKMDFKNIESYVMDLRIYGSVDDKSVNDVVRIRNYKNEQLLITSSPDIEKIFGDKKSNNEIRELLYSKGTTYKQVGDRYRKIDDEIVYNNTHVFLESIKSLGNVKKLKKETLSEITYDVYEVEFRNKDIRKILENTEYSKVKFDNIKGKIYVTEETVYKIEYEFKTFKMTATFFGINTVRETIIK